MQAQKQVPAKKKLWRNYVGDFRLVEFCSARAPLEVPKERKKQDTFNPSTKPR